MFGTISCTVTDKEGNSREVSGTRLRWHEAMLHAACAVLYLGGGLNWSANPNIAGWGSVLLAAGIGMAWMGIVMATRIGGSGDVGKLCIWVGAGTTLAAMGQGALGPEVAAAVSAIAGNGKAAGWATLGGFGALLAALYYDPKAMRNIHRDPRAPRADGEAAKA